MPNKKLGKYRFNEFEINLDQRSLKRDENIITVSPKTFELLVFLVLNARRPIGREEIISAVWPHSDLEESNLSQHIFLLRKAISGIEPGEKVLVNDPGFGYLFTLPVYEVPDDEEDPEPEPFPLSRSGPEAPTIANPKHLATAVSALPQHFAPIVPEPENHQPTNNPVTDPPASERQPPTQTSESTRSSPQPWHQSDQSSQSDLDELLRQAAMDYETPEAPKVVVSGGKARVFAMFAMVAAVVLSLGYLAWNWIHRGPAEPLSVVLGDFENSTGNHDFDQALISVLAVDLQQSPYLIISSPEQIRRSLVSMKALPPSPDPTVSGPDSSIPTPPLPTLGPALALAVCQNLKSHIFLTGVVFPFGHKYVVSVKAFDCADGYNLAASKGIADTPEGAVMVMGKVAADLRSQLSEPPASLFRFNKPLFKDRVPSLPALKAYADAGSLVEQTKLQDAVPLYQRAVQLDPQLAIAYADLGAVFFKLGQLDPAKAMLTKAYDLRNSVDEQTQFKIVSAYNDLVSGDMQASIRNDKAWSGTYPRNPVPFANLADLQTQTGKPALALDPARKSLQLDPENAVSYTILARAQMQLGQLEEATSTCRQASVRHLDSVQIHSFLLQIAYLRLDQPAIDEQLNWATGRPSEPDMQMQQAYIDFAGGKVKAGLAIVNTVAAEYRQQGNFDLADHVLAEVPRIEAELGSAEQATQQLQNLPTMRDAVNYPVSIPVAWAHVGETSKAEAIRERETNAHPKSTLWHDLNGPQIAAAIALNKQQPELAIEALEPTSPYEMRSFEIPALRGRAYLNAKQPAFAEQEFHKILDHPGIAPLSHDYPLARLGLARSLVQQDKMVEASFAYKIVLQLWKDADPDLPRLREARVEFQKLAGEPGNATPNSNPDPAQDPTHPRPKPHPQKAPVK